jgi:hypothetical protein
MLSWRNTGRGIKRFMRFRCNAAWAACTYPDLEVLDQLLDHNARKFTGSRAACTGQVSRV